MSDTDPATSGDAIRSLVAATRATTKAQRRLAKAEAKLARVEELAKSWEGVGIPNMHAWYNRAAAAAIREALEDHQ